MINEHGLEILENQNTPGVGRRYICKGGGGCQTIFAIFRMTLLIILWIFGHASEKIAC
jgi:hypothetical protein